MHYHFLFNSMAGETQVIITNKGQSNLAIGGIAVTGGSGPQISHSRGRMEYLSNNVIWDHTSVPAKWHLVPFNGYSRVHECDTQLIRAHRWTDHATVTVSQ